MIFNPIPKPGPRKSRKPPGEPKDRPEAETLKLVVAYCHAQNLETFHLPDPMMRASFAHGQATNWALRNAGREVRGFPDLIVFDVPRQRFLALELKRKGSGVVTYAQRDYCKRLNGVICFGYDEAVKAIHNWYHEDYEGKLK